MFDTLTGKLDSVFRKLRGKGVITEKNISEAMREIRQALLEADVNFRVAKEFIAKVKEKALGQDVLKSVTPAQQIVKIIHDELVNVLGGEHEPFRFEPGIVNVVLLVGLQGSGKTTFAGKLATRFKKKGLRPMLVACDIHRPAAIHQIEVVGKQIGVPVFSKGDKVPAQKIAKQALKEAERNSHDLVIVDTAGRLHIDEMKMDEVTEVKDVVKPRYTLMVADTMTGQDAVNSAKIFNEKVGIDGVCLTKMDGDARGGAALSIKHVTGKPILFIGTGEKMDALEEFHPDRISSRILGMGDVVTLVEKAQEAFDEKQAMAMQKRLRRAEFTFGDFLKQMRQMRKMGPLKDIMSMIPGIGGQMKDVDIDEDEMKKVEAMILSMTEIERDNPHLLNSSRRHRVAAGSGTTIQDVNQLVKQFEEARKMMKQMMQMGKKAPGGAMAGMPGIGGSNVTPSKKKKRKKKKKRH
jgi:signal recognition particle subunit SRP54